MRFLRSFELSYIFLIKNILSLLESMFLIENMFFQIKKCLKSANNRGKIREYQILDTKTKPRIVKTANTKPANNEGRLYLFLFSVE